MLCVAGYYWTGFLGVVSRGSVSWEVVFSRLVQKKTFNLRYFTDMVSERNVPLDANDYDDQTGQKWRNGAEPPEEPEPPLAMLGKMSRPATPDMTAFRKLNMRGRAEVICKYWVTEGYGSPASMLLFYVFKTAALIP